MFTQKAELYFNITFKTIINKIMDQCPKKPGKQ